MTKRLTFNLVSLGIMPLLMFSFIGIYLMNILANTGEVIGGADFLTPLLIRWNFNEYYFGLRSIFGFLTDVGNILPNSFDLMVYVFNLAITSVGEWTMQIPMLVMQQINAIAELTNGLNLDFTNGLTIQEFLLLILNGILLIAYVIATALSVILYLGANLLLALLMLAFLPFYIIVYLALPFIRLVLGYYNIPLFHTEFNGYGMPTWEQILESWANIFRTYVVIA